MNPMVVVLERLVIELDVELDMDGPCSL